MSKIQDVPFITKVIDTLSDELKSGLYDLIDGQVKTPVFRSLVNNDYAITEANDKGKVQFVTLETLRGNYTGYLAYNSVYCVLIAFKGNTQALDMLNINVAKHTFAFVNESLSILELRVELEDGKEGVTPTDLGVTNNNIHLAKGTTQIGEGVNLKTLDGNTLIGSGNVGFKTINDQEIVGDGNIVVGEGGTITIDTAFDETSTNAVQNKVVTEEFNKYKSLLENYAVNIQFENTSANILALTSDNGTGLGTDTGHWYYWNGTQYVDGGVYQTINPSNFNTGSIYDIKNANKTFIVDSIFEPLISNVVIQNLPSNKYICILDLKNNYNSEGLYSFFWYIADDVNGNVSSWTPNHYSSVDVNTTTKENVSFFIGDIQISCTINWDEYSNIIPSGTRNQQINSQHVISKSKCIDNTIFNPISIGSKLGNIPLFSWVDDDTANLTAITKVKTIADNLGIKCTFGCVTKYLSLVNNLLDTLKSYQLEGFHITTHSNDHDRWYSGDDMFTVDECENDLLKSITILNDNGFLDSNMFIYPGASPDRVELLPIIKKWCNCAVKPWGNVNHLYETGRYRINRLFITNTNNLDYYKTYIDNAYNNGDWLIFGTHSSLKEFDETLITNVLQYALNKGITITTLNQAFKKRKFMYDFYDTFINN